MPQTRQHPTISKKFSFCFYSFCKPTLVIISPNADAPVNQYFVPPTSHSILSVYLASVSHKLTTQFIPACMLYPILSPNVPIKPPLPLRPVLTGNHMVPFSPSLPINLLLVTFIPQHHLYHQHFLLPSNKITFLLQTNTYHYFTQHQCSCKLIFCATNLSPYTFSVFRLILSQICHSVYPSMHAVSHSVTQCVH